MKEGGYLGVLGQDMKGYNKREKMSDIFLLVTELLNYEKSINYRFRCWKRVWSL